MIEKIAKDAIAAAGLAFADSPDWDGTPKIWVGTEPAKTEDETQSGIVAMRTVLAIYGIADNEQVARDLMRTAAVAVYAKFETLENTRRSGILCITLAEHDVSLVQDRATYQAFTKFTILHTLTL